RRDGEGRASERAPAGAEIVAEPSAAATAPASTPAVAPRAAEPENGEHRAPVDATRRATGLRGLVTDSRGEPLAGAQVTLAGEPRAVTSGTDGAFELDLPATASRSSVHLAVAHELYVSRELEVDPAREARVALQALPVLDGRLLLPDGSPASAPARV